MSAHFRYAIIGCGSVGLKRLNAIPKGRLAVACDTNLDRAERFVKLSASGCAMRDFRSAVRDDSVDIVIVSCINSLLAPVASDALRAKKHVFIEKPAGVNSREIQGLMRLADKHRRYVRVGFNHRFHPAISKAYKLVRSGAIGKLMFVRGRYGHGGRLGYEKEWRMDPVRSGGGELIDQGVHLIDLARWFLGDFKVVEGFAGTYFWKSNVDDNAFLSLRTKADKLAWLHVSWTEWKNLFSFEIYGRTGKLHVDGLGGSYGLERLYYYKMLPQMGFPTTRVWAFRRLDDSWTKEIRFFEEDISKSRKPKPGLTDALAAMRCVEATYKKSGF